MIGFLPDPVALALVCPFAALEPNPSNPKPLDDDLIMPLPDGNEVAFHALAVPGKAFWAGLARAVQLGDASASAFEGPQRTQINGSSATSAGDQWLMVPGKCELTKGQFAAVMGLDRLAELSGDSADRQLPRLQGRERGGVLKTPLAFVEYWPL